MQPKVSIVIPCYNKSEYMHRMFDSILMQIWNNIELILVDDGSTDDTQYVITEYASKFASRGFELITIKQENKGLPAAVYEGLKRITGEYVCQVDADDELEPEYISTMAGWLSLNADYEWAACDFWYVYSDRSVYHSYFKVHDHEKTLSKMVDSFLLGRIVDMVWVYMVRSSYLIKSGVIDNYYHEINRTQEPQYVLPLAANNGRIKHFPRPLYRYMQNETQMSIRKTLDDYEKYYEHYYTIVNSTIEWLREMHPKNSKISVLAELGRLRRNLFLLDRFNQSKSLKFQLLCEELKNYINHVFNPNPKIHVEQITNLKLFFAAITDNIFNNMPQYTNQISGRIIAWGALGKNGRSILEHLNNTLLEPHELWDINGDGESIKVPDIKNLNANDTIFILPSNYEIVYQLSKDLRQFGCIIITYDELLTYVASSDFPQFYNNCTELLLKGASLCNLE
ncbi:glycosyltransferase family 2 protein [Paenibacillus sp. LS1]|uniref:glycosyltransferase family 2 protein n=1 Tax=Paenibacillus sp. LS1 TaxID=2992120 RepID=UPI00222E65C7|nr:glycosyltransferase family 2 protein [Paenibacillus sp. LS1]MCW3795115.1 glycosyltransferase family 2 protein [Paenibacillus sp. LS1]